MRTFGKRRATTSVLWNKTVLVGLYDIRVAPVCNFGGSV